MVPMIEPAAAEVASADVIIVVGTSLQVYPAAGLLGVAQEHAKVYYIDPSPASSYELNFLSSLQVIAENATTGVQKTVEQILSNA